MIFFFIELSWYVLSLACWYYNCILQVKLCEISYDRHLVIYSRVNFRDMFYDSHFVIRSRLYLLWYALVFITYLHLNILKHVYRATYYDIFTQEHITIGLIYNTSEQVLSGTYRLILEPITTVLPVEHVKTCLFLYMPKQVFLWTDSPRTVSPLEISRHFYPEHITTVLNWNISRQVYPRVYNDRSTLEYITTGLPWKLSRHFYPGSFILDHITTTVKYKYVMTDQS